MRAWILTALGLAACNNDGFFERKESANEQETTTALVAYEEGMPLQLSLQNFGDIYLEQIPKYRGWNRLIGGTPADRTEWPASFTTRQGNSRCTGTLIGPMVLQIAAHCVGNGRNASLEVNNENFTGPCTHAPGYQNDPTADWALCRMNKQVPVKWYESVLKPSESNLIQVGTKLILAGMGGTQPGSGGGGNDDVFRVGEAPVTRLPNIRSNDIVTKGSVALAYGDSGGSAFWQDAKGILKVAAVNSRGDIRTTSYLSAVYTQEANKFYTDWSAKNTAPICGLDDNVEGCRGDDPTPPPPQSPVPAWCKAVYDYVGLCIFGNPRESLTNPVGCRDEYAKLFACQEASELE